jgi:hypothetical protein
MTRRERPEATTTRTVFDESSVVWEGLLLPCLIVLVLVILPWFVGVAVGIGIAKLYL